MTRLVVVAGLLALLTGCGGAAAYPGGCRDVNLSDALCALAVVRAAETQEVDLGRVDSIDLLGDPCPGLNGCSGPVGVTFVVRVRFTMADGTTQEGNVYCDHDQASELCAAVDSDYGQPTPD